MMTEKQLFATVAKVAKKLKTPAYVVGGFVRNQLMKAEDVRHKVADVDFVVLGDAIAFAKAFDEAVKQTGSLVEFPDFGTARYIIPAEAPTTPVPTSVRTSPPRAGGESLEIEFATARSEKYDATSRKPQVASATLAQDLSRRDFTVNAMAREVKARGALGEIVDPFDGQGGVKKKLLKTPLKPDETFFDDPLRMLRAARFAAQLGFAIEANTYAAMKRNAERLSIVSAERIQEELFKLLGTPKPSVGLGMLCETGLMDQFFPEVTALAGVEEVFGYSHKDNLSHTLAVVDNIASQQIGTPRPNVGANSKEVLLRFAGLVHDIAKPKTKKFIPKRGWTFDMHEHLGKKMVYGVGRRLRMSMDDIKYVAKLVRWHLQPIALMDEGITDSAVRRLIVTVGEDLHDLLILCRSDITTGNQRKKVHRLGNYDRLEKRIAEVMEKDTMRAFQSPFRGDEIMADSGLKPGPTVGRIKEAIEEAILDGKIPNEYEAAKTYFESIKEEYVKGAEPWEKQ